ncbi:MAG TPA: sigma-70 family RNA polymerase sigma factor, partial [Anaerolineaceae bacterium]|nr:sigma-70 family RNA polymerase sigma factor [Anaerolineaceae bacterium]
YIRRSQRERRHTSLESLEDQGVDFPGAAAGPERTVEQHEQMRAVRRALKQLSESDRSLLSLAMQETLTQAEIADVLEISVGALKVRLCRARQRLAALVQQTVQPETGCEKEKRYA